MWSDIEVLATDMKIHGIRRPRIASSALLVYDLVVCERDVAA
jgi:hypothetical protein